MTEKEKAKDTNCQTPLKRIKNTKSAFSYHASPLGIPRQKECPAQFFNFFWPKINQTFWVDMSEVGGVRAFWENLYLHSPLARGTKFGDIFKCKKIRNMDNLPPFYKILLNKYSFYQISRFEPFKFLTQFWLKMTKIAF